MEGVMTCDWRNLRPDSHVYQLRLLRISLTIQVLRITMLLELQDNRSLPGNYRTEHVEVWNQIQILRVGAQVNPLCDGLPHRCMVAISTISCL